MRTATAPQATTSPDRPPLSLRRLFWRRLRSSRSAAIGGAIVGAFVVVAAFGPAFAPHDPLLVSLPERLRPPSSEHWLGTDPFGRDILSRLIEGSRISLSVGVVVGLVAIVVGVPVGVGAGYLGGYFDEVVMRAMDVLLALPGLLLAIAIVAALGPNLQNVMIAIGIVAVPNFARVARAATLRVKEMLYVEAARAVGAGTARIMLHHVLPNVASPLLVLFSLRVATALLSASSLGFLGVGAQPPDPEWGAMLSEGRNYLRSAPHVATMPGITIMLVVLGFNLLGDGLRDALDPKMLSTAESR
jgi:peptide/nickel transport system permease protein